MSSFTPAQRAGVGLLIGIAGETGSGKTFSALRLARGLAGGRDEAIAFIDTEAGRALHYAAAAGETPGGSTFGFMHADLAPPFTPERYLEKIQEADHAGFAVIVIDSFSHEWDGEGGCADIHDADLDAMVERSREKHGNEKWWDEATQREKLSITAWKGAKLRHKRMVSRLLQCRAHLVICMRAEDKLRIETRTEQGRNGREYQKTEITPAAKLPARERWQPICEKRFPYQLITSFVVTPDRPGVPIALKLQEQHRAIVSEERPLDEAAGEMLAAWARGETPGADKTRSAAKAAVTDPPGPPASPTQPASDPAGPLPSIAYDGWDWPADAPVKLPLAEQPKGADIKEFGEVLRALLILAPTADDRDAWIARNADTLLRIKARNPRFHSWIREPHPEIADAPEAPAPGDAADGAGGPLNPAAASPPLSVGGR